MNKQAQLLQELEAKADEVRRLLEGEPTQEKVLQAEGLNNQIHEIRKEIEGLNKIDDIKAAAEDASHFASAATKRLPQPGSNVLTMTASGETVITTGRGGMTEIHSTGPGIYRGKQAEVLRGRDYAEAFEAYVRKGIHGLSPTQLKQLNEGVDEEGGYLVPEDVLARVVMKQPSPTSLPGLVQRFPTSRDVLTMPKIEYTTDDVYTTGFRLTWTGEIPATATVHRGTGPTVGQVRIPIYTGMLSKALTNDLIEDSMVDVMALIGDKLGESIQLAYEDHIINGTGSDEPSGILEAPGDPGEPEVVPTGSAGEITAEGLKQLVWSIPGQYEDAVRIVMAKYNTGFLTSELTDDNNRYLWGVFNEGSGLMQSPRERTLMGYPVVFSSFMPQTAASAYPVIAGDLSGYYLVTRVGISVQVLREVYAELNQVVLLARVRFGGDVAEEWKLKILQAAAGS